MREILKCKIVHSLEEIPEFASEEEERAWWATHDLAEELGTDVTEEHHALIRRLKEKFRYVPSHFRISSHTSLSRG
jgi:hypothetical protein